MKTKREGGAFKIAISGKSGCGNTTVSRLVAETLGYPFINFTFRTLAEENEISLEEILPLAELDDKWDREVDRRQIDLAKGHINGCVLGSRLAIWLLEDADLKVYLQADSTIRTQRIMQREDGDFELVRNFTLMRDRADRERYLRLYNIDNDDYSFADLIINAGKFNAEQIAQIIVAAL
ncbi:MAG: cytidylate kinase family protein [Spirochaetaceae bacterium]|jgi:cytidylate kinase|nr:cytidylate kinase family protein [Spirochaetaceae bacterium]